MGQLLALRRADLLAGKAGPAGLDALGAAARRFLDALPFYRADLAVDGRDVLAAGFSGPRVGRELDALLERVQRGGLPNERFALLAALGPGARASAAGVTCT